MSDALVLSVRRDVSSPGAKIMSGNDIPFSTRTPQQGMSGDQPLRLRTWFDHTRNMMVVEVVADTPAPSNPDPSAK